VSFLLDTNIISEGTKPRPNPGVVAWLANIDEDRTFLSVVTFAEVRFGIASMPGGRRRNRLELWLHDELAPRFAERVLLIDIKVADAWGLVVARAKAVGRPIQSMDAFIAATAVTYDLTVVSHDRYDFAAIGVRAIDPWTAP
jgi:toxin FitB